MHRELELNIQSQMAVNYRFHQQNYSDPEIVSTYFLIVVDVEFLKDFKFWQDPEIVSWILINENWVDFVLKVGVKSYGLIFSKDFF